MVYDRYSHRERVARCVRAAVHDYTFERSTGVQVELFVDTDFVITTVSGRSHYQHEVLKPVADADLLHRVSAGDDVLAAALWLDGYLGSMTILPPHARELDLVLTRYAFTPQLDGSHVAAGLHQLAQYARRIRTESDAARNLACREFMTYIMTSPEASYIASVFLRESWRERLRHLKTRRLLLDASVSYSSRGDPDVSGCVYASLSAIPYRQARSISNRTDAEAIGQLLAHLKTSGETPRSCRSRFVTLTHAIGLASHSTAPSVLREYGLTDTTEIDDPDGIMRSADYLLVRAVLGTIPEGVDQRRLKSITSLVDTYLLAAGSRPVNYREFIDFLSQIIRVQFGRGVWMNPAAGIRYSLSKCAGNLWEDAGSILRSIEVVQGQLLQKLDQQWRLASDVAEVGMASVTDENANLAVIRSVTHAAQTHADVSMRDGHIVVSPGALLVDLQLALWAPGETVTEETTNNLKRDILEWTVAKQNVDALKTWDGQIVRRTSGNEMLATSGSSLLGLLLWLRADAALDQALRRTSHVWNASTTEPLKWLQLIASVRSGSIDEDVRSAAIARCSAILGGMNNKCDPLLQMRAVEFLRNLDAHDIEPLRRARLKELALTGSLGAFYGAERIEAKAVAAVQLVAQFVRAGREVPQEVLSWLGKVISDGQSESFDVRCAHVEAYRQRVAMLLGARAGSTSDVLVLANQVLQEAIDKAESAAAYDICGRLGTLRQQWMATVDDIGRHLLHPG